MLSFISAPEVVWAYLLSVACHITNGATDPELLPFRQGLLSAPLKFVLGDNAAERYWLHHQSREDIAQLGDSLKRSPIERGFDVMEAKAMMVAAGLSVSPAACAKAWADNVRLAKNSEAVKPTFIDAVFTVWARIMDRPDLCALVMKFETDLVLSPWDSMYKLEVGCRCQKHTCA